MTTKRGGHRGGPSGQLRIVAGTARGRRLRVPPGRAVRPTPDRVREALFSVLGDRCRGARVLDAFAGTGALGLEALSRGASAALLVERDRRTAELLRGNVERTGLAGAEVVVGDVTRLLPRLMGGGGSPFDIVLVDPPHGEDLYAAFLAALRASGALAPGGLVVVEHPADEEPRLEGLCVVDRRRYGRVALAFGEGES